MLPSADALAADGPMIDPPLPCSAARVQELVRSDYPIVWRFLRRLGVPECDVDDAAQLVFARVLARQDIIELYRERAHLMQAAFRLSFEYRRSRKRTMARFVESDIEALNARDPLPDEALALRREREMLDSALDQVSPDRHAVLTLFELEGMTFSEIAEVLGLPRGTVASRLRRAKDLFSKAVRRIRQGASR
jgi:RNA polymerase sigma-70 factor, ECF subfamily